MQNLYRSDSKSLWAPRQLHSSKEERIPVLCNYPSFRILPVAQHLLEIAACSNSSHSFLQQAGPTDIWHWTGRHRELSRFCPSAQLSDRFQLHESCSLSQNLPKVIFFPPNGHVHKHTQFSSLGAPPKCSYTLQKENKSIL